MTKVLITGAGVNSPVGCCVEECFHAIENGLKGINNLQNIHTESFPTTFAAEVKKHNKVIRTHAEIDRKELFFNNALNELISKTNFFSKYSPENVQMHIGAGIDYFDLENYINSHDYKSGNWQKHCNRSYEIGKKIIERYGIKGGFSVNVAACVASSQSVGLSYRILKQSPDKAIISGGFDSMLSQLHYMGFYKLGALSNYLGDASDACRPFDKDRCGLVIGEGGIAFLLESDLYADKNNILAEIVGYSSSLDAYMVTDPEPNGASLAKAALQAIEEAGITPDEIDCAHLHETGTLKNAISESKALQIIFGERYKEIPVYSMKGQVGHLIGACGAMEMIGVLYSLLFQKVPVTVNFSTPDPDVPVRVITGKPLDMKIKYILKLNAAFGGQNTALVFKKYES